MSGFSRISGGIALSCNPGADGADVDFVEVEDPAAAEAGDRPTKRRRGGASAGRASSDGNPLEDIDAIVRRVPPTLLNC